ITGHQRLNSNAQISFSTTFYPTSNNLTLDPQVKMNRRTSFTSSITSLISDDNYFPRSTTPTSDTSAESNDSCNDFEFKNISLSNEVINNSVLEENHNVLEANNNVLEANNNVLEANNNVLKENNNILERTNNEQLFMEKWLENNNLTSNTIQDNDKKSTE
ncbi:29315_t:CDS:1, partial [Racocetra persica]